MKKICEKYLDTKNKKIVAGIITGVIAIGCTSAIIYATKDNTPELVTKKNQIEIEYGEILNASFDGLVDIKNLNNEELNYLKKNVKISSNVENEIEVISNDDGTVTEKDKGYAKVGDYKITLTYRNETKTIKVKVKDTTAPELIVPENIEIMQGTDLATFDFKSLITATDLAQLNEIIFDTGTIDINIPGEYTAKAYVEDVNKNKAEKEFKVKVIAVPTDSKINNEILTDSVPKEKNSKVTGKSETSNSSISGSTGGSSNNIGSNTGGGGSNENSGNNSGSTGGSTGGGGTEEITPPHVHEWFAKCKCGYTVTSNVSFQDAIDKLKSLGHGSVLYGEEHASYGAGGCH